MGWKYSTEAGTTEVERRETLDDEFRFLREWQERAHESMRKLRLSARPSGGSSIQKTEGDGSAGS
jgi:hypothetical protein